jgi:hypothetical protein
MEPEKYQEITALNDLYKKYNVSISISTDECLSGDIDYPAVEFSLDRKTFNLFVDDEYSDFKYNYPLLSLCIVLRELESYKFSDDYLQWCKERFFKPEDVQVRDYYMSLALIYKDIEKILGKINSQISDSDFSLSMGAIRQLRENPNK